MILNRWVLDQILSPGSTSDQLVQCIHDHLIQCELIVSCISILPLVISILSCSGNIVMAPEY